MPICEVCQKEYTRKSCHFCKREERWPRYKNRVIGDLFPKRVVVELEEFKFPKVDDPRKGRYIFGPVGSGKTLLAAHIMLESIHSYYVNSGSKYHTGNETHQFTSIPKLLRRIKSTFDHNLRNETESQIIQELIDVDFLVLDDIGAERSSEWVHQILYMIINERYENLSTTIFTSNCDLDALAEILNDDKIPSRIQAMGEIQLLSGSDRRLKQ